MFRGLKAPCHAPPCYWQSGQVPARAAVFVQSPPLLRRVSAELANLIPFAARFAMVRPSVNENSRLSCPDNRPSQSGRWDSNPRRPAWEADPKLPRKARESLVMI